MLTEKTAFRILILVMMCTDNRQKCYLEGTCISHAFKLADGLRKVLICPASICRTVKRQAVQIAVVGIGEGASQRIRRKNVAFPIISVRSISAVYFVYLFFRACTRADLCAGSS